VRVTYEIRLPPSEADWVHSLVETLSEEFEEEHIHDPFIDVEYYVEDDEAYFKYKASTGNTHELAIFFGEDEVTLQYTYEGSRYGLVGLSSYVLYVDPVPKVIINKCKSEECRSIPSVSDPAELWWRISPDNYEPVGRLRKIVWDNLREFEYVLIVYGRPVRAKLMDYETSASDLRLLPWEQVVADKGIVPAVRPFAFDAPRTSVEIIKEIVSIMNTYQDYHMRVNHQRNMRAQKA